MSDSLQIPLAVQEAILANRAHFREMNERAMRTSAQRRLENPNGPHVEIGFLTKPESLEAEMRFWDMQDDEELADFLDDDILAGLYGNDSVDWKSLPAGYEPLILVLEFERHCAFEGWTAVSNRSEEMPAIIDAYRILGLDDEANALQVVFEAYVDLGDDDHIEFHDVLGRAYKSVPNRSPEPEDRYPVILAFVRNNARLFGVAA
jgi:hypothetical protein